MKLTLVVDKVVGKDKELSKRKVKSSQVKKRKEKRALQQQQQHKGTKVQNKKDKRNCLLTSLKEALYRCKPVQVITK
jgi:hypothetical protein